MRRFLPKDNILLLDIATGTADVLIHMIKQEGVKMAVGIDMAENMLSIGKQKIRKKDKDVFFIKADAMRLPFRENSFGAVTIAFGIRNIKDPLISLKEAYRVLRRDGKIILLEFSLPANLIIKKIYFFYLRHILPFIGRLISGDPYAYRYLNRTIEVFPYGEDFLRLMKDAGFKDIKLYPQTFGVCIIYVGGKRVGSLKGQKIDPRQYLKD
jgi:demethylmenaquinone methyltransferase/2-methoxy-6-polyprenyl-1,4-benzoquinol methylase